MIILTITDPSKTGDLTTYEDGSPVVGDRDPTKRLKGQVDHLATIWEVARDVSFKKETLETAACYYGEGDGLVGDTVNKLFKVFNHRLNPNKRYFGRAAVLLRPGGWRMVNNIEIIDTDEVNTLQESVDTPTPVSTPLIKTSCPANPHGSAYFDIKVFGFNVLGSADWTATSFIIEDTKGNIVWRRLNETVCKRSIRVNDIKLEEGKTYLIHAYFHTSTGDSSQHATHIITVKNADDIAFTAPLYHLNNHEPIDLYIQTAKPFNTVKFELVCVRNGLHRHIFRSIASGNRIVIPKDTLVTGQSYYIKIKTDTSSGWRYEPISGYSSGDNLSNKGYSQGLNSSTFNGAEDENKHMDSSDPNSNAGVDNPVDDSSLANAKLYDTIKDETGNVYQNFVSDGEDGWEEESVNASGQLVPKVIQPTITRIEAEIGADIKGIIDTSEFEVKDGFDEHLRTLIEISPKRDFKDPPIKIKLEANVYNTEFELDESLLDRELYIRVKHDGKYFSSKWSEIRSVTFQDTRGIETPMILNESMLLDAYPLILQISPYTVLNTTAEILPLTKVEITLGDSPQESFMVLERTPDEISNNTISISKSELGSISSFKYIKVKYFGNVGDKVFASEYSQQARFQIPKVRKPVLPDHIEGLLVQTDESLSFTLAPFLAESTRLTPTRLRLEISAEPLNDFTVEEMLPTGVDKVIEDITEDFTEPQTIDISALTPEKTYSLRLRWYTEHLSSEWSEYYTFWYGSLAKQPTLSFKTEGEVQGLPFEFELSELELNGRTAREIRPTGIKVQTSLSEDFDPIAYEYNYSFPPTEEELALIPEDVDYGNSAIYCRGKYVLGLQSTDWSETIVCKLPHIVTPTFSFTSGLQDNFLSAPMTLQITPFETTGPLGINTEDVYLQMEWRLNNAREPLLNTFEAPHRADGTYALDQDHITTSSGRQEVKGRCRYVVKKEGEIIRASEYTEYIEAVISPLSSNRFYSFIASGEEVQAVMHYSNPWGGATRIVGIDLEVKLNNVAKPRVITDLWPAAYDGYFQIQASLLEVFTKEELQGANLMSIRGRVVGEGGVRNLWSNSYTLSYAWADIPNIAYGNVNSPYTGIPGWHTNAPFQINRYCSRSSYSVRFGYSHVYFPPNAYRGPLAAIYILISRDEEGADVDDFTFGMDFSRFMKKYEFISFTNSYPVVRITQKDRWILKTWHVGGSYSGTQVFLGHKLEAVGGSGWNFNTSMPIINIPRSEFF